MTERATHSPRPEGRGEGISGQGGGKQPRVGTGSFEEGSEKPYEFLAKRLVPKDARSAAAAQDRKNDFVHHHKLNREADRKGGQGPNGGYRSNWGRGGGGGCLGHEVEGVHDVVALPRVLRHVVQGHGHEAVVVYPQLGRVMGVGIHGKAVAAEELRVADGPIGVEDLRGTGRRD